MLQGQKPIYILFKSTELFMSWGEGGAPAGFVCCVCVCKVFSYWCLSSFSDANKAFLIFVISVWSCCMWCDVMWLFWKSCSSHMMLESHTHTHRAAWMNECSMNTVQPPSLSHALFCCCGLSAHCVKKNIWVTGCDVSTQPPFSALIACQIFNPCFWLINASNIWCNNKGNAEYVTIFGLLNVSLAWN